MAGIFRAQLIKNSPDPISLFEVSLDTARTLKPQDDQPFVEYIRALLSERKPDLIVPVGAPAAFFMTRHRLELFPTTPMLILGADIRRIPGATLTENESTVLLDLNIPAYVENILRLRPETKDIALVVGDSPIERFWASEFRRDLQPFTNRVHFTWFNDLTFGEILKRASNMSPQSVILWLALAEDAARVPYSQYRALEAVREVANVPIFGIGDYQLGRGIVGGPLLQTEALGRLTAEVAFRILKGETPGSIHTPPVVLGAPVYDWRELQRWDISQALLPPDSIVEYREPNVWERYRWQITLAAAVLLVQFLLIAALIVERRRRELAELEARHRLNELAHMNRSLAIGAMSASIAHEINQPLAAIASSGNAGLRWLAGQTPNIDRAAAALKRIVGDSHRASEVVEAVKAMFTKTERQRELLSVDGLIESVLRLLRIELAEHRVFVQNVRNEKGTRVRADPIQIQQVLLNLVRNAIDAMKSVTNRTRVLRIRSEAAETDLIVTVEDSGPGIDAKDKERIFEPFFSTKSSGMGMGLSICRSIIESHGG